MKEDENLDFVLFKDHEAVKINVNELFYELDSFDESYLNPLDYSVWSILEEKACQKPHPNVESLKKAWKEITLETLIKIVDNFPKRLKACVDARSGHFE
uniref:Uncharacterized protein n=1 Tax=Acrobeloides nanus TaxID=290746 RepID=A0A914DX42_9BILA